MSSIFFTTGKIIVFHHIYYTRGRSRIKEYREKTFFLLLETHNFLHIRYTLYCPLYQKRILYEKYQLCNQKSFKIHY